MPGKTRLPSSRGIFAGRIFSFAAHMDEIVVNDPVVRSGITGDPVVDEKGIEFFSVSRFLFPAAARKRLPSRLLWNIFFHGVLIFYCSVNNCSKVPIPVSRVDEMNFQYPVSFIFPIPQQDAVVVIRVYVQAEVGWSSGCSCGYFPTMCPRSRRPIPIRISLPAL